MKRYLFGMDSAHPAQCARSLREHGFDSVVLGSVTDEAEAALAAEGIGLYLCFGAHSLSAGSGDGALARDFAGTPKRWFSSGCPNERGLWRERLNAALDAARRHTAVRGVFVDGARFASFASAEGTDAFYTCFCPRCTEKMRLMGFDPEALREAVRLLRETKRWSVRPEPLRQWLLFRERCVRETMDDFAAQVHGVRPGLSAGAFVFAPSLGGFVGQTAEACRSLDFVAPMLYRAYPHGDGPACLNHEWSAFLSEFADAPEGTAVPAGTPGDVLRHGFPPSAVREETALAARSLCPGQRLCPILQIEDASASESEAAAFLGGAHAAGYFMWGQAPLPENFSQSL